MYCNTIIHHSSELSVKPVFKIRFTEWMVSRESSPCKSDISKVDGNTQTKLWRITNRVWRRRKQMNKQAGCQSEGVTHGWMGWWSDGRKPGSSGQRTSSGARGGSEPSPGAVAQPWVSLLQTPPTDLHPISMKFHLLPGVTHKHMRAHTDNDTKTQINSRGHADTHTHTRAQCFHYP